eukprot:m.297201 g.297201  ORF g.297201 m.297201 type:complete len:96 (+) comp55163_c0_seq64:1877-2164(+)
MDGQDSDMFKYFKFLLVRGFLAARKHHERFVVIVDIMQQESHMPCFSGRDTIKAFEERFQMHLTEDQLLSHVDGVRSFTSCSHFLFHGTEMVVAP